MEGSRHLLVVDDEPTICTLVQQYLADEGYRVSIAHDGRQMRDIIAKSPVDLIIMDVVLPNEDGLSLVRSLRAENSRVPIIMLTGRSDTIDRIVGLEVGADDYLAKPFHLRELHARVKSVLRRAAISPVGTPPPNLVRATFAGWQIDRMARQLRSPAGEDVRLTRGEFDLLVTFVSNPNQVLTRDQLLDADASPFDRTIDVQVGRLRRKLNDDSREPRMIKTVRGGGYIFTVTVEPGPV